MEQSATPQKVLKTADKALYIREYKKRKYAEDPTQAKQYNRAQYYKTKYGCSPEEWIIYKQQYPQVCIIRKNLEQLKNTDISPELIRQLLLPYLNDS